MNTPSNVIQLSDRRKPAPERVPILVLFDRAVEAARRDRELDMGA